MMTEFTPGPWHTCTNNYRTGDLWVVSFSDGEVICALHDEEDRAFRDIPENKANAKLIAAAPVMYEVIKDVLGYFDEGKPEEWENEIVEKLEASLVKAEGREGGGE